MLRAKRVVLSEDLSILDSCFWVQ